MDNGQFATADEVFRRAVWLRKNQQSETALGHFKALLEGGHGPLEAPALWSAYRYALKCTRNLSRWEEAAALASAAVALFPDLPLAHQNLGEALLNQGRLAEAEQALGCALELDPELLEARNLLAILRSRAAGPAAPSTPRPWPRSVKAFENPRKMIETYVLRGRPDDRFIGADSTFTALGSCFAGNVARRLLEAGRSVNYETIGEEVNNTYANRYLLDWVARGAVDPMTTRIAEAYGPGTRARLADAIANTDVFILTLGVAPCFFHQVTGEFAFVPGDLTKTSREHILSHHEMRMTTVAENAENIHHILDTIRRLARREPRVVLTVSPVPLGGATGFESAVVADCLSKSTLRLACDEVLRTRPGDGLVYWPSFEIVRWLGAHYSANQPLVYGADDGSTHHVSNWIVDLVIDLFLKHHGPAEAEHGFGNAAPIAESDLAGV